MRIRILITCVLCICFLGIKADDSGYNSFALQGFIKKLKEATTDEQRTLILSELITEAGRSDVDLAKAYLSNFKDIVSRYNSPIAKATYYKLEGNIAFYQGIHRDSTLYWYDKAIQELNENQINDAKMLSGLHNNKANIYIEIGDIDAAVNEYLAAIEIVSNSDEKILREETVIIANFAHLLTSNHQNEEALEYILKALEVNKKWESELGTHSSYYEYLLYVHGGILKQLGRFDEAEKPLLDIIKYNNTPTPTNNYAKSLLGILYAKNGHKEMARKYILQAIEETSNFNTDIDPEVNAYLGLAILELEEDNLTSSIQNIDYIFKLHEKENKEVKDAEIFKTMAVALERSGRYKESLLNLKQYQTMVGKEKAEAEKLRHDTFKSQISLIEKKYEINELEIKQKLQESKISVLVVAFLLSIVSIFFIYMMYKKKEDHNAALLIINQEIRDANANVMAASKSKENFLSTMSHEMCTPMNGVIGIANILLDENPTPRQSEHLKNLKFSGEVLLNIINSVLDFSKISSNKLEIKSKPVHIQEFLDRTIESFRQSNTNRNVRIFQDQQLQELDNLILVDDRRFSQVLTNLLGNAIKFTSHGSIVLRSRIAENTKDTIKITFQIEDTGIGIPKEKLESIFDSFSQVNNEINREHDGAGLGLSITKSIIEIKGGTIEVKSTEGKGSTFTFTLQFDKDEKVETADAEENKANKIFQSGIEGKKILLVEDNKLNQLVARKVLKKFKVEVSLAENGQEAVEMVQKDRYDLILMDIHMPIMDGLEATRSIRALEDKFYKQIPIVALSADAYSDKVQATTESGMNDYIAKPFEPKVLFQKIKSNIERTNNQRGTA